MLHFDLAVAGKSLVICTGVKCHLEQPIPSPNLLMWNSQTMHGDFQKKSYKGKKEIEKGQKIRKAS